MVVPVPVEAQGFIGRDDTTGLGAESSDLFAAPDASRVE
jgi:hypothetical protein